MLEIPYNHTNNNDVYVRIRGESRTSFYISKIGPTGVALTAAAASDPEAIHTAANVYMKDTTFSGVFIQKRLWNNGNDNDNIRFIRKCWALVNAEPKTTINNSYNKWIDAKIQKGRKNEKRDKIKKE